MQEGAFAFIDCLGWKGIWKRIKSPQILIDKIRTIERFLEDVKYDKNSLIFTTVDKKATISFLSDTVVISVQARDPKLKLTDAEKGELIASLCFVVLKTMAFFLAGEPVLPMRGCIVYGEHLIDGNLILGKAVDDGAAYEKLADGAFVWLHPDASDKFEAFINQFTANLIKDNILIVRNNEDVENFVDGGSFVDKIGKILSMNYPAAFVVPKYALPLKGGGSLECSVLNPLSLHRDKSACQKAVQAYAKSMLSGEIGVLIKKQNTERFLEVAEKSYDQLKRVEALVEIPLNYKQKYRAKHKRKR